MSDLSFTYQSLLANKGSPEQYDNVLSQFFNATALDEVTTSEFVKDPDFPNIVQCVLFPITRYAIPSPSESKPQKIVFDCLHFLTHLAIINPDLLNIIAANVPFDTIIQQFFQHFAQESCVENSASSILIPILKFLSILSTSNEVRLENTNSINLLIHTISLLYQIPEVSHWSVSTLCGFLHNST